VDGGIYDLMAMWAAGMGHPSQQGEIIADLQDSLDDYQDTPSEPLKMPHIKFDQLGDVASQVVAFKKRLRDLIDRKGGVSFVAQQSGIPQPSLSRLLNSASMPRRSTLYKIANALNLPEAQVVPGWSR
jgi:DNA-binding phage protein